MNNEELAPPFEPSIEFETCCKYGPPLPGETCDHCGFERPEQETEPKPEPVTASHTFIVDVREFRAALEVAVCEKKPTIPVLTTVLLSPVGSTLRVLSTDLDKWTVSQVPAMIDDGAGNVLLPHRKTLELLKGETGILKITAKITTLSDKFSHAWVKLEVGGCEYDLPSMDPKHFPVCPDMNVSYKMIPGAELKPAIGRIIGCISDEESRYTINGALFESDKGKLVLVATDGHRLALDTIHVDLFCKSTAIIHKDALTWLYKHVSGDVFVSFGAEHSFFHVANSHTTLITRNVKGQFPNYQAVIPRSNSFEHVAKFASADEFAKTLAKVARMADERSGAVKFHINGACTLSASSTDCGSASAVVKASVNHFLEAEQDISMVFNSAYVLDVLKIAGKNPVVLSMADNRSAGVFTIPSIPDYSYVLMPMRI